MDRYTNLRLAILKSGFGCLTFWGNATRCFKLEGN